MQETFLIVLLILLVGSKLDVHIQITRCVLQALYELTLSDEDKCAYAIVLEPVVSPLISHFKVQDFMRIPIKLTLHNRITLRHSLRQFCKVKVERIQV
jgi:hypothetical protein